jgi:hypothetical protein
LAFATLKTQIIQLIEEVINTLGFAYEINPNFSISAKEPLSNIFTNPSIFCIIQKFTKLF